MSRLDEIASEVLDLINVRDIFEFLADSKGNMDALEARLQEVMQTRQSFETIELAMYLRTSFSRSAHLPTWQPLLNATVELIRMRGEDEDMLYGIVPRRADPARNTGQAVYKRNQP